MFQFFKGKYASHIVVGLFFTSLLAIGLSIFRDYGLCYDEAVNRKKGAIAAFYVNSKLNHLFLSKETIAEMQKTDRSKKLLYKSGSDEADQSFTPYDGQTLLDPEYRHAHYGVFFELFLIGSEWVLKLKELRDIYLMRHLLTFLMFYVSIIFFYLLLNNRFKNWKIGLLGCLFLVLSPRIFAHAFYNSKDLVFLSAYIISCYSLVLFLKEKNVQRAFWHALSTAILIDIRITGIIVPGITFLFYGIDTLQARNFSRCFKKDIPVLAVHFLFLIGFIVLFWPYLWENPLANFIDAFVTMSKYPWNYTVLYIGKYLKASQLPWHYLLVWLLITTPVLYTGGFIAGLLIIGTNTFENSTNLSKRWNKNEEKKQDYLLLSLCLLPLIAVIALRSTVYTGWRHLFFIYPAFLFVSIRGLVACKEELKKRLKLRMYQFVKIIGVLILSIGLGSPLWFMVKYHPFQNVYFNFLAGDSIEKRFERDYWGLSYRQALEHVLKIDKGDIVKVSVANWAGELNAQILGKKALRLRYVPIEEAKYFITNYYPPKQHSKIEGKLASWEEIFAIKVDEFKIIGVYHVYQANESFGKLLFTYLYGLFDPSAGLLTKS